MHKIINKIIIYLFPVITLKHKKYIWYKRINIYLQTFIAISMILWTLYLFFGIELIFSHKYGYGNIVVYSNNILKNKNSLDTVFSKIEKRLDKVNIDFKKLNANIYLPSNNFLFYGTMLPGTQIIRLDNIAVTTGNSIYFKKINIKGDTIYGASFTNILTHELVHIWQEQTYIENILKPKWIIEGYAIYATGDISLALKNHDAVKEFLKKYSNISRYIRQTGSYDLWGLMIKHAIEKMHKSVDDLHLGKVEYDEVLDSLLNEYNITKIKK